MKSKYILSAVIFTLAGTVVSQPSPVLAQAKKAPTAGAATAGKVVGAPTGKTFQLETAGGVVTVDASKARVRNNGRFAKFDVVTAGVAATVIGTKSGSTLTATEVRIAGAAKPVKAMAGAEKTAKAGAAGAAAGAAAVGVAAGSNAAAAAPEKKGVMAHLKGKMADVKEKMAQKKADKATAAAASGAKPKVTLKDKMKTKMAALKDKFKKKDPAGAPAPAGAGVK